MEKGVRRVHAYRNSRKGVSAAKEDKKWYCPVTKGKANDAGRMATAFILTPTPSQQLLKTSLLQPIMTTL